MLHTDTSSIQSKRVVRRSLDSCLLNLGNLPLTLPSLNTDHYPRSPLQDSRLLGPSPWKILATTYEQIGS